MVFVSSLSHAEFGSNHNDHRNDALHFIRLLIKLNLIIKKILINFYLNSKWFIHQEFTDLRSSMNFFLSQFSVLQVENIMWK